MDRVEAYISKSHLWREAAAQGCRRGMGTTIPLLLRRPVERVVIGLTEGRRGGFATPGGPSSSCCMAAAAALDAATAVTSII